MGTRFLLSEESEVPEAIKQAYFDAGVTDTVRTRSVDGVPQRVIRSQMIKALEKNRILKFPTALKMLSSLETQLRLQYLTCWRKHSP